MNEKLERLRDKLERRVQPKDEFYRFSLEELEDEILEAMVYLNPELEFEAITPHQEILITYKAMASCYYGLASKHAENMRFKVENDEYFGQMPYEHYMKLGQKYEELFEETLVSDGVSGISVSTVTRRQVGTGRMAQYLPGDTP